MIFKENERGNVQLAFDYDEISFPFTQFGFWGHAISITCILFSSKGKQICKYKFVLN